MTPHACANAEIVVADVAVIGAGPAGIAAATCAAERGKRVVVVDRGRNAGGQIWRHVDGGAIPRLAAGWIARFGRSGARLIGGASVVDAHQNESGFELLVDSSASPLSIRARNVILATGARELFIPFDGWTIPGVMGIGGAQALLKSGTSFAGKRVVIAGSGPLMLPVAASMARAGARLVLVAEQASGASVARFAAALWRTPSMLAQAAQYRARFLASSYATGTWVTAARGSAHLESVIVTDGRRTRQLPADVLCTGYGLVPNIELARLLECDTRDGSVVVDDQQRSTVAGVLAVGEATGVGGAPLAIIEGQIAGTTVGSHSAPHPALVRQRVALKSAAQRMLDAFTPRDELRALPNSGTIVCRCEDVSYGEVQHAACARQAKLYTRAGMGPCQGRTCMPGLEFLLAWQPDTVRPPLEPTSVSVLSSEIADIATPSYSLNSSIGEAYQ